MYGDIVVCLAMRVFKEKSVLGDLIRQLLPTSQQSSVQKKKSGPMKREGRTMRCQAKISPLVMSSCAGNSDRDPGMISGT